MRIFECVAERNDLMLKGKTAVVTGAGRGIGKAIALKLAENGADIIINDIPGSDYAEDTKKEIEALGVKAIVVRGDVRNTEDVENLMKTAADTFGKIDILVNNAGITRDGLMLRMSEEDWDSVLEINLKGAFNCIKAAARYMMKKKKRLHNKHRVCGGRHGKCRAGKLFGFKGRAYRADQNRGEGVFFQKHQDKCGCAGIYRIPHDRCPL